MLREKVVAKSILVYLLGCFSKDVFKVWRTCLKYIDLGICASAMNALEIWHVPCLWEGQRRSCLGSMLFFDGHLAIHDDSFPRNSFVEIVASFSKSLHVNIQPMDLFLDLLNNYSQKYLLERSHALHILLLANHLKSTKKYGINLTIK